MIIWLAENPIHLLKINGHHTQIFDDTKQSGALSSHSVDPIDYQNDNSLPIVSSILLNQTEINPLLRCIAHQKGYLIEI